MKRRFAFHPEYFETNAQISSDLVFVLFAVDFDLDGAPVHLNLGLNEALNLDDLPVFTQDGDNRDKLFVPPQVTRTPRFPPSLGDGSKSKSN